MSDLLSLIRQAIHNGRYVISDHADERLWERRILSWQAVEGIDEGKFITERTKELPNPVAELEQVLPDGTTYKAVWAWIEEDQTAKLVTVHYFDR